MESARLGHERELMAQFGCIRVCNCWRMVYRVVREVMRVQYPPKKGGLGGVAIAGTLMLSWPILVSPTRYLNPPTRVLTPPSLLPPNLFTSFATNPTLGKGELFTL